MKFLSEEICIEAATQIPLRNFFDQVYYAALNLEQESAK